MLSILPRSQVAARFEDHYGLSQRPFGLTLDQRFLYPSHSYTTALNDVHRALQRREGLVVVTGAAGTGKTMLCRTLLRRLDPPVCVSVVLDPRVTFDDLLLHVLTDFGVISPARQLGRPGPVGPGYEASPDGPAPRAALGSPTRHQLMRALQQFVASLIPFEAYAVLVIDEAQDLDPDVLEQLRLLLNFETDEAKLLQIVLIGQPELNRLLERPGVRQLEQRVARRCELAPLPPGDVRHYIERRLSTAQQLTPFTEVVLLQPEDAAAYMPSCSLSFTPSALRAVAEQSQGVPRMVNLICDRALEIGYERRTHTIDARIVRAAAKRLTVRTSAVGGLRSATRAAVAAALVVAVAGLGVWTWAGDRSVPASPSTPVAFAKLDPSSQTPERASVEELAVVDSFNVRVALFRAESKAAELAAQLEAAGLPAFVRSSRPQAPGPRPQQESDLRLEAWAPGPALYQVIVGPYLFETDTDAVRQLLAGYGHADSDVFVEHPGLADNQRGQSVTSRGAYAADARLVRVVLLRSADRMSLALEMTAEPKKAALRALSAGVLEVEAGPLAGRVRDQEVEPPGAPFIRRVSIRGYTAANRSVFVRVRVLLPESGRGNVRVVGRVVYIDVAAPALPSLPTFQEISTSARELPTTLRVPPADGRAGRPAFLRWAGRRRLRFRVI